MSADLLAEFGLGSAPAQAQRKQQHAQSQPHSLIPGLDSSGDALFTGASAGVQQRTPRFPDLSATSNRSAAPSPAPASRQPPVFPTIEDLPRSVNSDVLFDATLDSLAGDEDEDDWGEFEGPESTTQPTYSKRSTATAQDVTTVPTIKPEGRRDPPAATGAVDLLGSLSLEEPTPPGTKEPVPASQGPPKYAAVDDFGDFTRETFSRPRPSKDLEEIDQALDKPNPAEPAWDDEFGDWGEVTDGPSATTPPQKTPNQQHAPGAKTKPPVITREDDDNFLDDWSEFTDGPSAPPAVHSSPASPSPKTKPSAAPAVASAAPSSFISSTSSTSSSPSTVRPTNIPPPSVLLQLFLELFNQLQKAALEAKSQQRTAPPSPTHLEETASSIHNALQTATRVIAGRSLRWKRDTILSQSMRIGPARSGKSGGMKLNTVNKRESIKEEQDAVDVLSAWRHRAALFNVLLQGTGHRPIPSIADPGALKVVTARPEHGALKAPHACALCALKRDERIPRLDEEDVQDSFGEWWTEHWGHTQCRRFWELNRGLLGQR